MEHCLSLRSVQTNCFSQLSHCKLSGVCEYGPFGPRRPKQLNGHIRKIKSRQKSPPF